MDEHKREMLTRSLAYMGLQGGEKITDIAIDRVFIGSCTNGRIEDLRAAAKIAEGKHVNANVNAMIVPGSGLVKEQAEAEGLDKIFKAAGFDWREPGCSMCLAMNPGQAGAGRALRLDVEPQFRRTAGLQGPHASGVARDGGGSGDCRQVRRRARVEMSRRPRRDRAEGVGSVGLKPARLEDAEPERAEAEGEARTIVAVRIAVAIRDTDSR